METLVAAHAKSDPSAPPTEGITDTAPPLAGVAPCDDQERQDGGHLSDEGNTYLMLRCSLFRFLSDNG